MKSSHQAIQEILTAMAAMSVILRDLDPGRTNQHKLIEERLDAASKLLTRAEAFE